MSITGNSNNIFVNDANLKIAGTNKGLIFSDGSLMYTAPPNSDNTNTAYFSNAINAFVITESSANVGFAGNTAPEHSLSIADDFYIDINGNLVTNGNVTATSMFDATVGNVGLAISNLQTSNTSIWLSSANASNIIEGTLANARLPTTVSVTTVEANDLTVGTDMEIAGNRITHTHTDNENLSISSSRGVQINSYKDALGSRFGLYDNYMYLDANNIEFRTDASSPVRYAIFTGGKLGIGTDNPSKKLEVSGEVRFADTSVSYSTLNSDGITYELGTNQIRKSSSLHRWYASNQTTEWMRLVNGNVGIGTTTPISKVDVVSGGASQGVSRRMHYDGTLHITPPITSSGYYLNGPIIAASRHVDSTGALDYIAWSIDTEWSGAGPYSSMLFKTNNGASTTTSEKMRIHHNGNVGIGTTNPNRALQVASGGVEFTNGTSNYLMDTNATYEKATYVWKRSNYHRWTSYGNVEWMRLEGGKLGIGITQTAPLYAKLHVNGTAGSIPSGSNTSYFDSNDTSLTQDTSVWNNISIYGSNEIVAGSFIGSAAGGITASDERIKSNIQHISDTLALDQLRLLQPKTYQYKDTKKRGTEITIGFIAQEVKEVIPEAVQVRSSEIPNIYELANVSQSNVIIFTNFNTANLNANSTVLTLRTVTGGDERVTLANVIDGHTIQVVEDLSKFTGSVDENGNVITETVTTTYTQEEYDALEFKDGINTTYTPEITTEEYEALTDEEKEAYTVTYSKTETVNVGDQIFVYGQEVDDFNFIRKESIFTIATAALQEVDRQQQADKVRIATLESQVAALLSRVEALENNTP